MSHAGAMVVELLPYNWEWKGVSRIYKNITSSMGDIHHFAWRAKQAGQLASKMRFISAPWLGLLDNDVWLKNARHANAMAKLLGDRLKGVPGVRLMFEPAVNAVFAELPVELQKGLRDRGWRFYTFIGEGGCRLMCAWDTPREAVDRFADDLIKLANHGHKPKTTAPGRTKA